MDNIQENTTEVSDIVSQLVEQLKITATHLDKKQKECVKEKMTPEEMESLLVDYSSKLIKGSVDTVDELKQLVLTAPNAKDVEALAVLISSSAAAIDSLNKIYIANKRITAAREMKQMDIDSKKLLQQTEIQGRITMNREDLMKQLLNDAKVITIEEVKQEHQL